MVRPRLQLALDGVGIVRLADVIVGKEIRRGRLVQLLGTSTRASWSLCQRSLCLDATVCRR